MMKRLGLIVWLVVNMWQAKSQNYAVEAIPAHLKNRANAVIRDYKTVIEMEATNNVSITISKAVTVLNINGDKFGQLALFYDKNISLKSVKGEIYDEFGRQIGKFSLSSFKDESAVNDFSLYEDSRVKYYIPQINTYPYTIVYQYEIKNKQNLIIPQWQPIPGYDVAVEKSSYQFICKPEDEIRIHAVNYKTEPETIAIDKRKSLLWKLENISAVKYEIFAPNVSAYFTSVKIAPKNFNYFNFKGAYSSWAELGKLSYEQLLKDKRMLLPETVSLIKDLVKNETTDAAKARKIYEYMQRKTRYISVQIGIGGFQPFKAADVDQLGYGDCKALVNYMQSLLEAVGIESYYCVVEAGEEKTSLIPSFASMEQGNHVILCLPLAGDTTWLECTSQDAPFGYLGSFTDDRLVLACTKDGGKLLKTPKYEASMSTQTRIGEFKLLNNGNVEGDMETKFEGSQFENHAYLLNKSAVEREKQLKYIYDINNILFKNINLTKDKTSAIFIENLGVSIHNYAVVNNDKLFFTPNLFNVKKTVPTVRNRALPVAINRGYLDVDSISFTLDDRIFPIVFPKSVKLDTKFGIYELEIKLKDKKLVYYRRLLMNDGLFSASDYEAYENFVNEIAGNDRLKIVLSLKK